MDDWAWRLPRVPRRNISQSGKFFMKKFLIGLLLSLAVCTPAFAHSHIGIRIQAPGISIGYHNGWYGHDRFDLHLYPAYPNYLVRPYQNMPSYLFYQHPRYVYRQIPVYCISYYGNPYICGYRTILVPTY